MDEKLVKLHQIILGLVPPEQLPAAFPKKVTEGNNEWSVAFAFKSSSFLVKSNELILFFRIHLPFKIEVAKDVKHFDTTVFELDFLIRLFSDASLFPLDDCHSREFVLEFSKFYAFQCHSDLSSEFSSFQSNLKLDDGKEAEELKTIRQCPIENKQNLKKIISDNQTFFNNMQIEDDNLLMGSQFCTYLVLSLFMPFLFSFVKDENKLVHWPVAGPMRFNCRIIKHEIINTLNNQIMKSQMNANELSHVVPHKICVTSAENSLNSIDASSKMSSLFSDTLKERPEFKNLRAVFLESNDFIPLLKLFHVSFCLNILTLLISQPF